MIDAICAFTRGGVLLWMYQYIKVKGNPVDELIKRVLLEERTAQSTFKVDQYTMKWLLVNKLDLVFVVIYQGILPMEYLDKLLEDTKSAFVKQLGGSVGLDIRPVDFDDHFKIVADRCDGVLRDARKRPMKGYNQAGGRSSGPDASGENSASGELEDETGGSEEPRPMTRKKDGPAPFKPKGKKGKENEDKKGKKDNREWAGTDNKVTKKNMDALDMSKDKDENGDDIDQDAATRAIYGAGEEIEDEIDVESLASDDEEDKEDTSLFGRLTSRIQNVTGNRVLTEEVLSDILKPMREGLMSKNVAANVADALADSVKKSLVGKKTASFTSVGHTVKEALTQAMERILTPKRSVDVLRDALAAKAQGRVYTIVFLGVNGVGKSTNLAKVAYYLKHKGDLNVLIAACDTFRSGAVEQLKTHSRCLGVDLFDRGYGKDAADIARQAIHHAGQEGYDVVLVDTAGRMQDNEPLMRALAKLVAINTPDLVLFVGEALVGNDSIDQLTKFNRSLIDLSFDAQNPRGVDGILLTKYDTVDDKVGAALSMVYESGQPVVFVGTGQKYTHLRKMQVKEVVRQLMG